MLMCAKRSFLCGGLEAASEKTAIQNLSMVETFCVSVDEENGRFCGRLLIGQHFYEGYFSNWYSGLLFTYLMFSRE